ncbi:hypothetical protein M3Y97_01059400 [Aphelenchoides bicaudatus]|nr:hypothetical protein M3Y97_01059400 [Aphelenchoides bicaudatus]
MNDEQKIRKFIRQQILNDQGPSQTLRKIYEKFFDKNNEFFPVPSPLPVMFDVYNEQVTDEIFNDPCFVYKLLLQEFRRVKRLMELQLCPSYGNCKCFLMSPRYSVQFKRREKNQQFMAYLYDNVWREKKQLCLINEFPENFNNLDVVHFNENHFLIVNSRIHRYEEPLAPIFHSMLELYTVDLDNLKCSLVDKVFIPGSFSRLVFDSNDSNKFVIQLRYAFDEIYADSMKFRKGKFVNGRLLLDDDVLSGNDRWSEFIYKLEGETTHGVEFIQNNNTWQINVNRMLISSQQTHSNLLCSLDTSILCENEELPRQSLSWFGNSVYLLSCLEEEHTHFIAKIDLDGRTFNITHKFDSGYIGGALFDDGVLNLLVRNRETNQHTRRRIPLSHPDSLESLCMDSVYKMSIFMNEDGYNKVLEQMPPILKPFGKKL